MGITAKLVSEYEGASSSVDFFEVKTSITWKQ